jgi:hypothetical protein
MEILVRNRLKTANLHRRDAGDTSISFPIVSCFNLVLVTVDELSMTAPSVIPRAQRHVTFRLCDTSPLFSRHAQSLPATPQEFHALLTPWDAVESIPQEHSVVTGQWVGFKPHYSMLFDSSIQAFSVVFLLRAVVWGEVGVVVISH